MHLPDPRFPPLLSGHPINAPANAFAVACERAASGELGAADIVWGRSTTRVDMALILEPDVPLKKAREIFPLAYTALADSLGALMPPLTTVLLRWPSTLLVNGGEAGQLRFAASTKDEEEVPDWLVVGMTIELQRAMGVVEPGLQENTTALFEEGGGDLDRSAILESFAAHMLTWINDWQDDGFAAAHSQYIGRLEGHEQPAPIRTEDGSMLRGSVLGLSDDLELLVKLEADGTMRALSLAATLAGIDGQ